VRNLIFVALIFLLAPVASSFVDGEETRSTYWSNGRVRSVVSVRRAISGELVREGPCRFMREDGSIIIRGSFRDDLRHGRWIWYQPDGREHGHCDYTDDAGLYQRRFPNGQTEIEGRYRGANRVGVWTEYYPSGRVRLRGSYLRGVRDGEWILYSDSEEPDTRRSVFENGNRAGDS
jgi:antitoxin component YwqK of YwqJK toxin-antitoxin module